jgi:hypothetical protein
MTKKINVSECKTYARIDTHVLASWGKRIPISITITNKTNIMAAKKESQCVVFLASEHIFIEEPYESIKNLINSLK